MEPSRVFHFKIPKKEILTQLLYGALKNKKKQHCASKFSTTAHLQTSEPGMYCDNRECNRGIRRRSTHLFSHRSPGEVGQDEQDSVSCNSVKGNLERIYFCVSVKSYTYQEVPLLQLTLQMYKQHATD